MSFSNSKQLMLNENSVETHKVEVFPERGSILN